MKMLKKIVKIVAVIILLYVVASFFMPTSFRFERSTIVNAPIATVFAEVNDFNNMIHWSPWYEKDTTAKTTVEGTLGQPGYKFTWSSNNKDVGHGSLTRVATEENKSIENDLFFQEFNMRCKTYWDLEQTPAGIKTAWHNGGDIAFMLRLPMRLMNMEKMMAPDLEKGLAKLKVYCEAKVKTDAQAVASMTAATDSMAVGTKTP